tara:strand:+ start:542 stop:823 length:282 start_codon:yes stop_codon:yes gene_type:complete
MSKINLPIKKKKEYVDNRKFDDNGDIVEKKCSVCGEFKFMSEFHNNKLQFDGTYPHCKKCQRERVKNNDKIKNDKKKGISNSDLETFFSGSNE